MLFTKKVEQISRAALHLKYSLAIKYVISMPMSIIDASVKYLRSEDTPVETINQ